MLALLQFFAYILAAYGLAALLLVPVVTALGWPIAIDHVIQRGGMLLAILAIWPFFKYLGLANRTTLGYGVTGRQLYQTLALGLLTGIAMLLCLVMVLLWLGVREPTPGIDSQRWLGAGLGGLSTGLLVATLEETFFRGGLFAAIRRQSPSATLAIFGSALLYSALHFFRPQPLPSAMPVTALTVLSSLGGSFSNGWQLSNIDAVVGLLLVGIFLGLIRERTGHLGWGIGLHAGWILVIKITHVYTDVNYNAPWVNLVGHYDGITGWLAAGWIGSLAIIVAYGPALRAYLQRPARQHRTVVPD